MGMEQHAASPKGRDIELALHRISDYLRRSLFFQNASPEDREPLKPCDLSGLALARIDLADRSLPNLIAVKAILTGADLSGAKLNDAKLNNAVLVCADLSGAKLNGAELNNAVLVCAELNGAKLNGAELNNAELNDAKLIDAKLIDADLNGAELICADLRGADVFNAKFTLSPSILSANFENAENFDRAEFYTKDGMRVTGVTIGADGHLVPAQEDPAIGSAREFGDAAQGTVAFKDIYPDLLNQAQQKGYLAKNPKQEAGSSSDPSATPS